jgi:DNA mismatch repair protein MutS2
MNAHTLAVLEFDVLLQDIAEQAQSAAGAAIIRSTRPQSCLQEIQRRRGLYADMIALRGSALELPSLRCDDLSEIFRKLAPQSAVIDGEELLACRSLLDGSAELHGFAAHKECLPYEDFRRSAAAIDPCPPLREALHRSLDRDGSVLDAASASLRDIRRRAAALEQRIQRMLDAMLRNSEQADALQDKFVTVRNGRHVIPVKREARGALPGIVHDLSNSGQTLFVEPQATLPLGNDLVAARAAERDEIRRILSALSARARDDLSALQLNQRILAELDAANAIARWAIHNRCTLPSFGAYLVLKDARHPLLLAQFRKEQREDSVIPLDFELPRGKKVLAITGSNTGGKTVALKTIGLLVLAAQSGFPVPAAADSLFTVFEHVLADIGDEQSIEASLSTFSAHIHNISSILRRARQGRSLVLLDELGSGTDPVEGGAIACGILDELARCQALSIATTHLGLVKNFVHSRADMINGAVRFNAQTLKPEYRLDIGRPGASHALHIAKRLGLPAAVIKAAENMLSHDHRRLEDMLARMESEQRQLSSQSRKIQDTQEDLSQKREALKKELDELRRERKRLMHDAQQQASGLVDNTRREMENLIRQLREQAKRGEQKAKAHSPADKPDTEAIRRALAAKSQRLQRGLQTSSSKNAGRAIPRQQLAVGKKVWIEKLHSHGIIEGFFDNNSRVALDVNGVIFTMKSSELASPREADAPASRPVVKVSQPRVSGATPSEINLVGQRVEDAIDQLEVFLNRSLMARLEQVRVVHGFGTGRLRDGIHAWLRQQSCVTAFRLGKDNSDPGGAGCTILTLQS